MEKYSTVKSLASVLIFIAWLNLLAGIILAIYASNENLDTIMIVSSAVGGSIGFILLLSFGKLIQLAIDIRENQVISNETNAPNSEEKEEITESSKIEISDTTLLDLRKTILSQKRSVLGKGKDVILDLLKSLLSTKQNALDLISMYEKSFGVSIIDELKSLSSNYSTIREYLEKFIEYEIVEEEYPHKLI